MEAYKIEKGIQRGQMIRSHPKRFPFPDMQVGDSFFVPVTDQATNSIRQYATSYAKACDKKFALEQQIGGTRIWRIA